MLILLHAPTITQISFNRTVKWPLEGSVIVADERQYLKAIVSCPTEFSICLQAMVNIQCLLPEARYMGLEIEW